MATTVDKLKTKSWTRDSFLVSTDSSLIPISDLATAFASEEFYWARPLPEPVLRQMLDNSLCFGLYAQRQNSDVTCSKHQSSLKFLGVARCVTDFTTFLYLTDVWVDPTQQGKGLGTWLISCVQEVIESMPFLRRSILMTADWERSVPFYEKLMKMELFESQRGHGLAILERKGEGHPSYGRKGAGY